MDKAEMLAPADDQAMPDEVKDAAEGEAPSPVVETDIAQSEGKLEESKIDEKVEPDENITVTNVTTNSNKVDREGNCYCGKERNMNIVELLCANCSRWYHESCIGYQLGKLVPFMLNYIFVCKNCSSTGLESFKKNPPLFPQMCTTALANLMQSSAKDGVPRTKFSKDRDIIPFIECHWEGLTTLSKRVRQSNAAVGLKVLKALTKEVGNLFTCEESAEEGALYSLIQEDLSQIKPNYDLMIKQGQLKVTDMGIQHAAVPVGSIRRAKRKALESSQVTGKKFRGETALPKLPAHGYPLEHPFNKDGYRYILAEPDPHAPFRQEFDESSDWAGKPIPGWLYRALIPGTVLLALHDRAPQLRVSEDRLTVTGDRGYCMIRATHGVRQGSWYFEVTVNDMKDGAASRIGWGQEYCNLQAPLGYDKFGYSWRSRKGTVFHESRGKHYSDGYGEGDTLGFLISLPYDRKANYIPATYKDKPLVKFKSHLYYEEKDRVAEYLKKLRPLSGSKIRFFKNGVCQGVAFSDIYAGAYFPAIALFKNASVTINFGPNFKHFPDPKEYPTSGMHLKAKESITEQTMADLIYLTENDGKLRLDTYSV